MQEGCCFVSRESRPANREARAAGRQPRGGVVCLDFRSFNLLTFHFFLTTTMPPPDLTANTLPAQSLPPLEPIDVSSAAAKVSPPVKRIQTDEDLAAWKQSDAHRHVSLFVARLGEAAVGKETQWPERGEKALSPGVQAVVKHLETLDAWTRDIEPKKTPQRFGNTAFRDWGARLEEVSERRGAHKRNQR